MYSLDPIVCGGGMYLEFDLHASFHAMLVHSAQLLSLEFFDALVETRKRRVQDEAGRGDVLEGLGSGR